MSRVPDIDSQEILELFLKEDTAIKAYVHAAIPRKHEAEDVQQEIWKTVCEKIGTFDRSRPFRPWLMGIARLEVLKWRQRHARNREYPTEQVLTLLETDLDALHDEIDERKQHLSECLKQLPDSQRGLLQRKYVENWAYQQMADHFRKSLASLQMQMTRIRRALRKCMDQKRGIQEELA